MPYMEFGWQTGDHIRLFAAAWLPESAPEAAVCLVHGLGEHLGRYQHFAEVLNQAGYALLSFDLRGHGRSGGQRGHAPRFEAYMEDIDLLIAEARRRYPDLPLFLYGHSLGGLLVLNYVLRRKPSLAGVIATGSGLRTSLQEQKIKVALAKLLGSLSPKMSLPSGLVPADLARDPAVGQAYTTDPYVHDKVTLGIAGELMEAIDYIFENAGQIDAPLLLMHGEADSIAYPKGSTELASLVSGCTCQVWKDRYHEIHNDYGKEEVFAYLLDWMEARKAENSPGQRGQGMGKFEPV